MRVLQQLAMLLFTLIYLAKNYPELIPSVIGLVVAIYLLCFGVNKLVQKASGEKSKDKR